MYKPIAVIIIAILALLIGWALSGANAAHDCKSAKPIIVDDITYQCVVMFDPSKEQADG